MLVIKLLIDFQLDQVSLMKTRLGHKLMLQNLRFADDILLVGRTLPQVQGMLQDLAREAAKVGLKLHMGKTKVVGNVRRRWGVSAARTISVGEEEVEVLEFDGEGTVRQFKPFATKVHDCRVPGHLFSCDFRCCGARTDPSAY